MTQRDNTNNNETSNNENVESRRRFLKLTVGVAAVAAVAGSGMLPRLAKAAGLPPVDPSKDPTAKALHYTEDAAATKNPKHKQGDDCSNCMFYQGKAGAARGPCQLFPGKSVNAKGWCVSHTPKAAS